MLNAEQGYQQARLALVQAEAARYADTAALFQALGGGWWQRSDLGTRCAINRISLARRRVALRCWRLLVRKPSVGAARTPSNFR